MKKNSYLKHLAVLLGDLIIGVIVAFLPLFFLMDNILFKRDSFDILLPYTYKDLSLVFNKENLIEFM